MMTRAIWTTESFGHGDRMFFKQTLGPEWKNLILDYTI